MKRSQEEVVSEREMVGEVIVLLSKWPVDYETSCKILREAERQYKIMVGYSEKKKTKKCLFLHKWKTIHNQYLYKYLECEKCGKRKIKDYSFRNHQGGYQPMKYPNWEQE